MIDRRRSIRNGASEEAGIPSGKPDEVESRQELSKEDESSDSGDAMATNDKSLDAENIAISSNDNDELETLAKERDALRDEVAQVRKALEEIQDKHEEEIVGMREQLAETKGEKDQAETQYRGLLGKVSTIRSQLGERLKADAVRFPYL